MQEGFHNVTILGRNTLDESELVQVTFEMVGPTRGLTIEDWQEVTRLEKIRISLNEISSSGFIHEKRGSKKRRREIFRYEKRPY